MSSNRTIRYFNTRTHNHVAPDLEELTKSRAKIGRRCKPGLSAACASGRHWSCYKKLCTCNCGHAVNTYER